MMKRAWAYLVSIAAAASCTAASAGTVVYYHNDIAGTPIAATNESGAVLWRESYRPYGERLTNSPASSGNDVWFTSRRQDVDTGLVYMGARYYDPMAGRFLSTDPVGFDEANVHSFNRYAYANNNPLKYKDPDGRAAETIWDLASFAISVGMFKNDPTLANFLGAAVDGVAVAIPFVPGGVGIVRASGKLAEDVAEGGSLVYRAASGTPDSMTPRALDVGGLSAFDSLANALPGKNQVIDTSKLSSLCVVCDNVATGHVAIVPKEASQMQGWISSRGTGDVHPLTKELMGAVVGTVRK